MADHDTHDHTGVPGVGGDMSNPMTTSGDIIYGGASGTPTRLAKGTNGDVLTLASGLPSWAAGGGGGGGGGWTLGIDESGASFANFSSQTGTWASNGTIIQETGTGSPNRCRHNTLVPLGAGVVMQSDIRIPTGGTAGILIGYDGANGDNSLLVRLDLSDSVVVLKDFSGTLGSFSATVDANTWYTLFAVTTGHFVSVFLDGTLLGTIGAGVQGRSAASYVGLDTESGAADFRNIKVWTVTLPA